MLNVDGAGVSKVWYISDTSFCENPFISPKAPKALMISVRKKHLSKIFFAIHDKISFFNFYKV